MKRLPSFTALFLVFVAGLMLQFIGGVGSTIAFGSYTWSSVLQLVMLIGLALMVIAPLLILLKFFMRLDHKDQR